MLRINTPEAQVRDPPAADDPFAFQALESALDRMDRSIDPAHQLPGMQLFAGHGSEERKEARGGLATREGG